MRTVALRAGILLAAVGVAAPARALDPARPVGLYQRERWAVADGFAGGVHAIAQDAAGYLWVGTERGLVRFDGREFAAVPGPAGPHTAGLDVLGAVLDGSGTLWLRLSRPALVRYRDGRFEDAPLGGDPREVAVTAMTVSRSGTLLAYGQASGLLVRAADRFRFEHRPAAPRPGSIVLAMAETPDGRLLLGTRDAGLYLLRGGELSELSAGLPDRKVNAILAVSDTDAWIGTDRGLVRWNGRALDGSAVPQELQKAQVLSLLRDRESNLWVGTGAGLVRLNARGASILGGSTPAAVTALFEDREGDLWIGRGDGLERLHDSLFASYSRAQGLFSEATGAVHADPSGRVWFSTADGGLYLLRGERIERLGLPGANPHLVYSIAAAHDGVWVGLQRGRVVHLSASGRILESLFAWRSAARAQESVVAVQEARDGTIWAGTLNGGLWSARQGRVERFTVETGLPSNSVTALLESQDGTLWVGTPSGLVERSVGGWATRRVRDGLPSDAVTSLLEDGHGVLWIGTSEGLAFLRAGRLTAPRGPSVPRDPVLGLAEGEGGWLWLSTPRRLMRVRRDALLEGSSGESDAVTYGRGDGLLGVEGIRGHRSVVADHEGRIWFSTNRGLAVVTPRRALAALVSPLVHVRSLVADDREVVLDGDVRVPPRPQRLRFACTAISLRAPERVRFRYRLDGLDSDWSDAVSAGEAAYANLGPGSYRFRVVAAVAGQPESDEVVLPFVIAPAVWQTAWFRAAGVLALLAAGWLFYAWRLGRVTRRLDTAFQERLSERTRIARELHDTLLQGFVGASMQLHVAAEQVPEGSPARPLLARIQKLVSDVIEDGRTTVQGLRSAREDAGDLAEALSRVGEDDLGAAAASLRVLVEGTPRPLHPAVRDELYRIGREALLNSFRHARAESVEVEIDYSPRLVRLLVRDDGVGVDPTVLRQGRDGHFGFSGMRERAERIGGRLRLWSAAGAGTEIEVVVRAAVAFASGPSRRRWRWLERLRGRAGSVRRSASPRVEGGGSAR